MGARAGHGQRHGPTKTAIYVALSAPLQAVSSLKSLAAPIGSPAPGLALFVLDECLRPLPPGVVGELYVAGVVWALVIGAGPGSVTVILYPCLGSMVMKVGGTVISRKSHAPQVSGDGSPANRSASAIGRAGRRHRG